MKLLIYTYPRWAFGQLHNGLAAALRERGWTVTLLDWTVPQPSVAAEIDRHDHVMTVFDGPQALASYGIPREKITLVAHAEFDIQGLIAIDGVDSFNRYKHYGVVSDSLACSSIALGITRIPTVVRTGVEFEKFRRPIPWQLKTVGYTARMERKTNSGVEQKRGAVAQACAEEAGLTFKRIENLPIEAMPDFYASVDALVMPSLQEGSPLPPREAAAAGRLVIGTPVGDFPRLAYEGMGILGPLDAKRFQRFAVEKLLAFKNDPRAFQAKCTTGQEAAKGRDWANVVDDWIELFEGK
jgi:glycosyltransferase involved in cell wall biosynthesis